MDIEKAYEMVWRDRVLEILKDMSIEGNMFTFIKNFLEERYLRVRVKTHTSSRKEMENGLPQGSVLSVLLFIMTINEIISQVDSPIRASLFADDLTLTCLGKSINTTMKLMQRCLRKLEDWTNRTGFKFSQTKTEYMIISRKKIPEHDDLSLGNQPLVKRDKLKILGMIFDKKLTWVPHIVNLRAECQRRLNIIKILASARYGADRKSLMRIFKATIQSKLDFGSIIYDSAKANIQKSLEPMSNTALRLSIGAYRTSPVSSVLAEAGGFPLSVRRKFLCMKYASASSRNPAFLTVSQNKLKNIYKKKKRRPKPTAYRIANYLDEYNLASPKTIERIIIKLPPWKETNVQINMDLAEYDRGSTTSGTDRALLNELIENREYTGYKEFYTVGSIMDDKRAFAVTTKEELVCSGALPPQYTIFSCEAIAIEKALEGIILDEEVTKALILTDSKSAVMAVANKENKYPRIRRIQQKLIDTSLGRKEVVLIWIPAHQGIPGNEPEQKKLPTRINKSQETTRVPQKSGVNSSWGRSRKNGATTGWA